MLLIDHSIKDFARLLSSDTPAPGGGSTAALEGALGISLTHMVGSLTVGREKYAQHAEFLANLLKEAQALQEQFLAVIDEDTQTYNKVTAVFAMPKATDAEKASRKEAMQAALKDCTKPPLTMMELSLKALELTLAAVDKTNTNASSDLAVASLSLKAAVQGAWLNVLTNISGINDTAFVAEYRTKGEAIIETALPMADTVYDTILKRF